MLLMDTVTHYVVFYGTQALIIGGVCVFVKNYIQSKRGNKNV